MLEMNYPASAIKTFPLTSALCLFTAYVAGLACPSPAGEGVLFSCVAVDTACCKHALGDLSCSLSLKKAFL